jgi:hypothetical protein
VEAVAVDEPAVAEREDLDGGPVLGATITSTVPTDLRSAACRSARCLIANSRFR